MGRDRVRQFGRTPWRHLCRLALVGAVVLGWALVAFPAAAHLRLVANAGGTFTVTGEQGDSPDGCANVQVGDTVLWRPDATPPAYHLTIHRTHAASGTPWLGTSADTDWTLWPTSQTTGSARRWTTRPIPTYDSRGNLTTRGPVADAFVADQGIGPVTLQAIRPTDGYSCRFQLGSAAAAGPTTTPTPTLELPPLQAGLVCDTGAVQGSGRVTCAASVTNKLGAAHIVYRWNVDGIDLLAGAGSTGQVATTVADNVLTLDNVPADGATHAVKVSARDTVNHMSADSQTVTFTRTGAGGGGPVAPPLGPGAPTQSAGPGEPNVPPPGGPEVPVAPASNAFPFVPVSIGAALAVAAATAILRRLLRQRRACADILPRARRIDELSRRMQETKNQITDEWATLKAEAEKYEKWRADIDTACGFFDFRNGAWYCPLGARGAIAAARVFNTTAPAAVIAEVGIKTAKYVGGRGLTPGWDLVKATGGAVGSFVRWLMPPWLSPNPVTDLYANKLYTNFMERLREQAALYTFVAYRFNESLDRWKAAALQKFDDLSRELSREMATLHADCETCPDASAGPSGPAPWVEEPSIQLPYVSGKFTDPWLRDL